MTDLVDPRRDRALLAAELALGLLGGKDRAEAERQLLRDPAFRAEHAYWMARAGEWLEDSPAFEGGSDHWTAIEAAIEGGQDPVMATSGSGAVDRRSSRTWAIAATVAALLAGVSTIIFYQREGAARQENAALADQLAKAQGELQIAQISGDASKVLVSALYNPASGTIDLKLELASEQERVPELWVIPGDGQPRSLGIFRTASATVKVDPSLKPLLTEGTTLAVTMEPVEGAPHKAPTGSILGATELRSL